MMEREVVRDLDKLPPQNKLAYCKLLALMVGADLPINQLKMAELYRLLANIRISSSRRAEILDFMLEPHQEKVELLCQRMVEGVNQQEKNILRFSLIKDLMIIIGSDFVKMPEEEELLRKIESNLEITEEQKSFLEEEYNKDQIFHSSSNKKDRSHEIINETVAKATALGIPLSAVYFSGLFKGFGPLGTLLGLEQMGAKRYTKRYSSVVGLGVMILGAFSTYHLVKWGLGHNKDEGLQLKLLIEEKMKTIHQRAIQYLKRDIELHSIDIQAQFGKRDFSKCDEKRKLLIKTLGIMKNTAPRVI